MKPLQWQSQRGASLLIVVAILLIVGIIGAVFVSLIGNESFTAMNQSAGLLAFGVADGGVEFEQYNLAQNVDWYRSTTDPMPSSNRTLGTAPNTGSFTVSTNLPATRLRRRIPNGVTNADICVYTTAQFTPPAAGYLQIGDIGQDPFEFVHYNNIGASPGCAAEFAGITRNQAISGVTGTAQAHERGEPVYPVTTLLDALANNCTALASLRITNHPKFLTAGTLSILTNTTPGTVAWEEISYTGSTRDLVLGVMTLLGVQRCRNGTASAAQFVGNPITPILAEGTLGTPDYEAEIVSTGTTPVVVVGSANRVIRKTVQR
ncbi:MAG: hypothetical protein HY203_01715 [Nitrospirae bacterium]|nr:hypothetical protein [Nitrospirota bacterium]